MGQHGGLPRRYSRQTTREQLDPTSNTAHEHRQNLPKATYWPWIELKTKHYALSHEPWSRPWRNTKIQSHKYEWLSDHHLEDNIQGYTKNRLKSSSFIHEAFEIKIHKAMKLKTTRCSCPWHARCSIVYGRYHELSRHCFINSDNLHEGTSPWAGNRWWQYQTNSDTNHDLWTISTRCLDQWLHWWLRT